MHATWERVGQTKSATLAAETEWKARGFRMCEEEQKRGDRKEMT